MIAVILYLIIRREPNIACAALSDTFLCDRAVYYKPTACNIVCNKTGHNQLVKVVKYVIVTFNNLPQLS